MESKNGEEPKEKSQNSQKSNGFQFLRNSIQEIEKIWGKLKAYPISTYSTLASIFAVILSLVAFLRDCSQDRILEEQQYTLTQNQYRPNIKIADLAIGQFKLIFPDSTAQESLSNEELEKILGRDSNSVTPINTNLEIAAQFSIINTGNSRAKIIAEIYADTISGERFLKKLFNEDKHFPFNGYPVGKDDYYSTTEISPGDTIILKRNLKIQRISKNRHFTIHALFFYQNELDQLFDTYYWSRHKVNEIKMRLVFHPDQNILVTQVNREDAKNAIKLIDENTSSSIYGKEQAKQIIKRISSFED